MTVAGFAKGLDKYDLVVGLDINDLGRMCCKFWPSPWLGFM